MDAQFFVGLVVGFALGFADFVLITAYTNYKHRKDKEGRR